MNKISSHTNIDEKGKFDAKKTEKEEKMQMGVISSSNLIPNKEKIDPVKILKGLKKK